MHGQAAVQTCYETLQNSVNHNLPLKKVFHRDAGIDWCPYQSLFMLLVIALMFYDNYLFTDCITLNFGFSEGAIYHLVFLY